MEVKQARASRQIGFLGGLLALTGIAIAVFQDDVRDFAGAEPLLA